MNAKTRTLVVRRKKLCQAVPSCPRCSESKQVQLKDWLVVPAVWRCRSCGHEFTKSRTKNAMSKKQQDPYEVIHPDSEVNYTPKFATWKEALTAQKKWNRELSGHKARKRRFL